MKNQYEIRGNYTVVFIKRLDGVILETKIDTEDLEKVKMLGGWSVKWSNGSRSYYARTPSSMYLHRFIMDSPKGFIVDHQNHDTLDNRKSNLRVVSNAENGQNRKGATRRSKSGIRGVRWAKESNKWRAEVMLNRKSIHIGLFDKLEDAEKAVIEARAKYMPYSQEALQAGAFSIS